MEGTFFARFVSSHGWSTGIRCVARCAEDLRRGWRRVYLCKCGGHIFCQVCKLSRLEHRYVTIITEIRTGAVDLNEPRVFSKTLVDVVGDRPENQ